MQKCDFTHTCQQVSALRSKCPNGSYRAIWPERVWSFPAFCPWKQTHVEPQHAHCNQNVSEPEVKPRTTTWRGKNKAILAKRACLVFFFFFFFTRLSVRSIKADNRTALGRRSLEVSQRCTCTLSSPNWRWIIYNSDGHVPAQVMPAPCALSTCYTNLTAATLNLLTGLWHSICVDKVGQFFSFITGHRRQFKE